MGAYGCGNDLCQSCYANRGGSPIFRTWCDRIDSGTFTKAQCGQWIKAVVALSEGERPQGKRTNLTAAEATELRARMRRAGGVALTDEHTAQGVEWCRRYGKRVGLPAWVWEDFATFRFRGEGYAVGETWGGIYRVPVWEVYGRSGQSLKYAPTPWQSGRGEGVKVWEVAR